MNYKTFMVLFIICPMLFGCTATDDQYHGGEIEVDSMNPLASLDSDNDGHISPYEAMDVIRKFELALPTKKLSPKQLSSLLDKDNRELLEGLAAMLNSMDENGDGFVDEQEAGRLLVHSFERLDQDGSGGISQQEFSSFRIIDILKDEQIAIDSLMAQRFDSVDLDGNEQLSRSEITISDYRDRLEDNRDLNNDNVLTREEMRKTLEMEAAPAQFEVEGTVAYMYGTINASTPAKVLELYYSHPQVTTIEMLRVPGSIDDDANIRASSYVRKFGYNTRLNRNSMVASGGTDFFLAGVKRSVAKGAMVGVHSWEGNEGQEGKDVAQDDPQHKLYLDYYEQMEIPAAFYWFTLEAAPATAMYWMNASELNQYHFNRL